MHIRKIAQLDPNYSEINREERNYAAILFAALCKGNNAERFIQYCGFDLTPSPDFGIYFEYAYLRDLWSMIGDENVKKRIICDHLKITGIEEILNQPIEMINRKFGVGGVPSKDHIQNPGKWALVKFNDNFQNKDDILKICRFKWSFNIKPDIVIHLDKEHAICIEAKYESGEGSYPSSGSEKQIFREHGLHYVDQTELQTYMMEELLGIKTSFMFLVKKKTTSLTHKMISWAEAFQALDMTGLPPFALEMVSRISTNDKVVFKKKINENCILEP